MKNPLLSYNEDCDRHAHQTATITTTRNQIVRQIEIVAIQNCSPIVTVYTLLFVVAVAYIFFSPKNEAIPTRQNMLTIGVL